MLLIAQNGAFCVTGMNLDTSFSQGEFMKRNQKPNLETNSRPQGNEQNVQIKKMTPSDIKGSTEKNKTVEDAPAPRAEQAP